MNRSEYGRSAVGDTEYSLFVGDLSPEVSDDMLLDFFRKRYTSVRVAKVVCDDSGYAKGIEDNLYFILVDSGETHNSAVATIRDHSQKFRDI